jgi:cell wall-associated NlpC family hydrolase
MHRSRLVGGLAALAVLVVLIFSPVALATDLPPANPGVAAAAVRALGVPYVAGGASLSGFDAPGLAKFAYGRLGKWLPMDPAAQAARGVEVTRAQLRRGDLLFFGSDYRHVGIFVGGGQMIDAAGPGAVVARRAVSWTGDISLRRYDTRTGWHAAIIAKRYLGVPYVFGGASPSGFDASGFTMYVYAQLGVSLAHGATVQQRTSRPIPLGKLRRGDLVFYGSAKYSYHVAIYVGNGTVIHAPHTGAVVEYGSLDGAWIGGRLLPTR